MQSRCIENIPVNELNVLAVDDEPFNLEILSEWLVDWGMNVDTSENGQHALSLLATGKRRYHAILLDRMMPQMDGFEFLAALKQHPQWTGIPVVMQSASATVDEIQYAFAQGVWYYLCKPFDRRKLYSIIETAISDAMVHAQLRQLVKESSSPSATVSSDIQAFEVKTLTEAHDAAVKLACLTTKPEKVVVGLYELLQNAVEHGNLEIAYKEKTHLLYDHAWKDEIAARLGSSPYCDRTVNISVTATDAGLQYRIKDNGKGFKSDPYMRLQTHRAGDNHGRGIAIANNCSFARLEYRSGGTEVLAFAETFTDTTSGKAA